MECLKRGSVFSVKTAGFPPRPYLINLLFHLVFLLPCKRAASNHNNATELHLNLLR
jgi:hypothetical protein